MPRRVAMLALFVLAFLPASAAAVPKSLEGTFVVVHIDDETNPSYDYWLEADKKRYKLKLKSVPKIKPNSRVKVGGDLVGDVVNVNSIALVEPAAAMETVTRKSVLVMLVNWTAPDSVTPTRAVSQVGDIDHQWFGENSYGLMGTSAVSTPWLKIPAQTCSSYYKILQDAELAAIAAGFDLGQYEHKMIYFPYDPSCGWAGLGQVNGPITWINGYMNTRLTVHELGHNLSLWHSNTLTCRDGLGAQVTLMAESTACMAQEYGDPIDVMGSSQTGHFNAAQKDALNWLGGRIQRVTADASFALAPMETTTGLKAAVITSGNRSYWLEYRQAQGFDSFASSFPGLTDGVLVHTNGAGATGGTVLLDARPSASPSFDDAALAAGRSWTTPEGIVIRVDSATGTEARVTVNVPDRTAPTVTSTAPADGATGVALNANLGATFSEPMDQAATAAAYTLTRSSDGARVGGTASWSGTTMTFDPSVDLVAGTSYSASVGTGARDLAGNAMATSHTARLTTLSSPGDNLIGNASFESDLTGWGSYQASLSRVALSGAPDGGYVAKTSRSTGTTFAISNDETGAKPAVASTTAGTTYVGTAYVRAASSSSVGKPVQIFLRERNASGATIRQSVVSATLGSSFARIGVSATAVGSGNTLGLRVNQNSAVSGNAFYADQMTVRKAATVMGDTVAGTVWTRHYTNIKRVSRFAFATPATVDIVQARAYIDGAAATSGSQPLRAVLYADNAGAPAGLIRRSDEVVIAAGRSAGWVTFNFSSPVRINSGSYWLGMHAGGSTTVARYAVTTEAGALRFNNDTYSDGSSSSFGTPSTDSKRASIHAIGG